MTNSDRLQIISDLLQKGLGRTFDEIKQLDKLEIRECLLDACLHDLRYDSQCESSRAEWLFELITLTEDIEFYREKIFAALPITSDFWDLNQLYDLVFIWAKQGDTEARELIYKTFKEQSFSESWLGGENIIALDGIDGLLAVAEIVGDRLLKNDELWEDDNLIDEASKFCDRYAPRLCRDRNLVISALEKKATINIKVKAYLDAVKAHKLNSANVQKKRKNNHNTVDFETIIKKIEGKKNCYSLLLKFGRHASEDDIERVFEKLLLETQETQLIRYLSIFKYRPLPRLDKRLFELAESNNKLMRSTLFKALSNISDQSLRNLAVKIIKQKPEFIDNCLLTLFIKNYQLQDFKIIKFALSNIKDIHTRHYVGMDLIEIINEQRKSELINCALWVYENTPCSYCRQSIVENLIDLKKISPSLIAECLYDCSPKIRELVAGLD